MRLALVGCGAVARRHADALRNDPRAEWRVFCDPRPAAAEAFRDAYAPRAAVETDFAASLERRDLDAVILCSPNAQHFEQACLALDHRLHVLCEKPLAVRRDHIEELVRRTRAGDRIVSIAHQRRYKAAYTTARRELTVRGDDYGRPREVHIYTCEGWSQGIVGTWRDDPTQNLGYCGDSGIHQIDVVRFLTGCEPRRLYAVGDRRDRRVQIVTRILAEFDGGLSLAAHYVGDAHHWREDVHVHCERGDLLMRSEQADPRPGAPILNVNCSLLRCRENVCAPIADMLPENDPATALLDAIERGTPTVSPPEIALPIFLWNEAVAKSLEIDDWVNV